MFPAWWPQSFDPDRVRLAARERQLGFNQSSKRGRTQPSKRKRQRIYARDGHRCVTCGATKHLTLDHVIPRSLGGTNSDDNLQTMCRPCNQAKGATV